MASSVREYQTTVKAWPDGRSYLELPYDPDEAWGVKERHHITGSINGMKVRGPLERLGDGRWVLSLNPSWQRDSRLEPDAEVAVVLAPEGPQRDDLPPQLAAALEAEPDAGAFFDSLATFYRKGYLRWLEGAARRPEVYAERVRELIGLLKAGKKTRGK
jgi:hypothetical protein